MAILPYLAAAGGAGTAYFITNQVKEHEFEKKLDFLTILLALTPDQISILEAIKKMSLDEMETHVKLGLTEEQKEQISGRLNFEQRVAKEVEEKCREMIPDLLLDE